MGVDLDVLAEGEERASDHGDDRRGCEDHACGVPVLEVAVDEHAERDEPADRRGGAERPALEPPVGAAASSELQAANASSRSAAGQRASRIVPDVYDPTADSYR